jgi:very-short-patch-repair endonuclease
VRDERSDGTATLAEPRAKRRVRVEADRAGNDTNACGPYGREKASQKGKYPDAVGAGYRIQHKGRRRSEKAGASRLSDRQLRNMRKCEQRYARDLRKTATDAEKKFASFLKRTGIRYEFQKPVEIADRFYIVDFYLWEYATVIEIDGGYHETEAQRAKDDARTKDLSLKREYSRILRISNDEVMAMSDAEKRDWLAKNIFPWFFR